MGTCAQFAGKAPSGESAPHAVLSEARSGAHEIYTSALFEPLACGDSPKFEGLTPRSFAGPGRSRGGSELHAALTVAFRAQLLDSTAGQSRTLRQS